MAEYLGVLEQGVNLNEALIFTNSIPCPKGCVFHENGTGIFTLRGVTNNCFARYKLDFQANVAVPEAGAVTPIGIAIAVNGEPRPSSLSIFTPQAVEEFGTVVSTATITVPKGCCFSVSVRYVSGVTDGTTTPTPTITVRNSNLNITRIA